MRSLGWAAGAMAVAAVSILSMTAELRVPRQTDITRLASEQPLFGLSLRSAEALLTLCEEQLAETRIRLLPGNLWRGALVNCRSQAELVTSRWPTEARAWQMVAETSARLGEEARFGDAMQRSQVLAPAVQWLAQRRLTTADGYALPDGHSYDADVRTLLASDIGARALARHWLSGDAARRERIEAGAATATPGHQARLLDRVRELAGSQ